MILRKKVAGQTERSLVQFVARAARAARLRGEVNVLLTTNRELRSLNRRFRGKDHATDVLSFPPMTDLPGDFSGDIAISAEMAAQNARRLKHSAGEEVRILVLHGILHLAGYDHEQDDGRMARAEMRLRRVLRLPGGLIERNHVGKSIRTMNPERRPRAQAVSSRPGRRPQ